MEHPSTILIVDDELFGRYTLEALLTDKNYILAFAHNGPEALQKAQELTPDLVLLDVMMPDMDGFEVCRLIRDNPRLAEVPVIMVTALDDRASRIRGIEAGADDLITKPFDPVELTTRVRTITRLNRYRRLLMERARFERVTELAPDGIVIFDDQGMIQLANSAIQRLLDMNEETTLIGTNVTHLIAPEETDECQQWLSQVINDSTEVTRVETRFIRRDGQRFPVEVTAGYIVWDNKSATQMIVRDITQRKYAEEALRESEKHLRRSRDVLRALFDGLDDGLCLLDSEGTILTINQYMGNLLGVLPNTLIAQSWNDVCSTTTPPFPGLSAIKALSDGRARHHREHYTTPQGTATILDIQIIPLCGPEQMVDQIIIHVVEATERMQLESLAIQNAHFAARGRMAATVAHEINTPLQSIKSCLYLASKANQEQCNTYLQLAREEIERISSIVSQLLDLPNIVEQPKKTAIIDLNALIERMLLLTGGTLANHGIDVIKDLIPNSPSFHGNADHLTQVLLNLILNAIDAMPDGGKIWITTWVSSAYTSKPQRAQSSEEATAKWTQGDTTYHHESIIETTHDTPPTTSFLIEITDTGCGISQEVQNRMFDPFFTTKTRGSGVGLAISQRIISQHHGQIKVYSTPGNGTTFRIILPITLNEEMEAKSL